jgi:hypothetical protein
MQKGIQHAAIQTVIFLPDGRKDEEDWKRPTNTTIGWGSLAGHQHSKRWFWIWWHRIHVVVYEELSESWVLNTALFI